MPKVIFMGVRAPLPDGWAATLHAAGITAGPADGPLSDASTDDWHGAGWSEFWIEYRSGDAQALVGRVLQLLGIAKPAPSVLAPPKVTPFRWSDPTWIDPAQITHPP